MSVVLHDYWRSSASYRVRIALGLASIAWTTAPVDLVAGEQRATPHLQRNPQGLVPVLEIDGLVLTQSLAIVEYLDETRHLGLLPRDAAGRARARALAYAIAMEVAPVCNLSVRAHAAEISGGKVSADDWQRRFIGAGLTAFEQMLDVSAATRFCHGDTPGLADLCLMPQLYNAARVGIDAAAFPLVTEIAGRLSAVPAFAAAHPDNHKP